MRTFVDGIEEKADWRLPRTTLGWWALVAFCSVALAYMGLRQAGLVTFAGYHEGEQRWAEVTGLDARYSNFGWPVFLLPGEALRASYDLKASSGSVVLRAGPLMAPLRGLQSSRQRLSGHRAGAVLFVAERAGFYSFETYPDWMDPAASCRAIGPNPCAAPDLGWSVSWHIVSAAETAAAKHDDTAVVRIGQ